LLVTVPCTGNWKPPAGRTPAIEGSDEKYWFPVNEVPDFFTPVS